MKKISANLSVFRDTSDIPFITKKRDINLPIINSILPCVSNITTALNVPRNVLACDENIKCAWKELPRELANIPPELRDELIVRMCVATATGLFDSAINYIWNCSVRNLRRKVVDFGFSVIEQTGMSIKPFDEQKLNELKDAELLKLCLTFNLISEEAFFFLDQCRNIRNNFSAAHPSIALIDDRELIVFVHRCSLYALSTVINLRGVDTLAFISAIKGGTFSEPQLDTWHERLVDTHEAQRELLFGTLHGIYCDPNSNEESRMNALQICRGFSFTSKVKSNLLNRHYEYQANGNTSRHTASLKFFEELGLFSLLSEAERHSIISNACKMLISSHLGMNNFYNEPPFAQRLEELSHGADIPDSAKEEYVISVLTCYVGNGYGVSRASISHYASMIKNFSPKEIKIMLTVFNTDKCLKTRLDTFKSCKDNFFDAVNLIDNNSIPETVKNVYEKILQYKQ